MGLEEELGRLNIKVTMDDSELAKKVDNVDRSLSKNAKTFSAFSRSVRGGGQEIAIHAQKMGMLKEAIVGTESRVSALNKVMSDSTRMDKYSAEEQDRIRGKYAQGQSQLAAYKNEFVDTSKQVVDMQTKTTGMSGTLYSAGKTMSSVGSTLTHNISAPLGVVGGLAIKTGMDFEAGMSRVQAISGASKSQLKQLTDQAVKLGQSTSFSASEVSAGMENLASAGFSVNEIMEATPGLLDLAAVSGGDVASASEIAASSLRAFNMDASDSGHVADVFAQAAADTNAEVGDMGEAMKYAAPVAHQLGMSIEETSAAIGIMSDNGIKGSQAGTTLRGALTRLAKPTEAMTATMDQYGLSFFDANGKMKPFGEIIGQLKSKVGGLDEQSRAAALTTLFGKEALSGMMALVETGPGKFNKLTNSFEDSDGAASKMAKTMQDNAKNQIEQMMGALETAAIKIEQAVAPTIKDLANFVGKLADAFSNLSPTAQKFIVQMGLIAVAAGPALSIIGKVTSGTIGMVSAFRQVKAGAGAVKVLGELTTGAKGAAGGLEVAGAGAGKFAGLLSTGLSPAMFGVIGAAALLGGAVLLVGKHFADQEYANRWGDGISKNASKSIDAMQDAQQKISNAMMQTGNDGETASKKVGKSFEDAADQVKKSSDSANKELQKKINKLPEDVQESLQKSADKFKKENEKRVQEAQTLADNVNNIEKQSGKLSIDQQNYVSNARRKLNELNIKSLGLTAKQEKQAIAALNGDISKMTTEQKNKVVSTNADTVNKLNDQYKKNSQNLKDMLKSGEISRGSYNAGMKKLTSEHDKSTGQMIARMYEVAKANDYSYPRMKKTFDELGISVEDAEAAFDKYGESAKKNNGTVIEQTEKMSKKTSEAVKKWNSLVFDEKTGEVKTNAKEEITEAMKSGKDWDQLKLAAKQAKVNSNARQVFAEAAIESGKWDNLTIKEKKMMVSSNAAKEVLSSEDSLNDFNSLSVPVKQVLVSTNAPQEVKESLDKMGEWDSLPESVKNIYLKSNVTGTIKGAKISLAEWEGIKDPLVKKLLAKDTATQTIKNGELSVKQWNDLPSKIKYMLGSNKDVVKALEDAKINVGKYNSTNPNKKHLDGEDSGIRSATGSGISAIDGFNGKRVNKKSVNAKWDGQGSVNTAKSQIDSVKDKTVSLTVNKIIKDNGKRATGDDNWRGGKATVNDQKGSLYKEMIRTPSGRTFIPKGRNRRMNLPKGTQIFNAADTARLMTKSLDTTRLNDLSELNLNASKNKSNSSNSEKTVVFENHITIQVSNDDFNKNAKKLAEMVKDTLTREQRNQMRVTGGGF